MVCVLCTARISMHSQPQQVQMQYSPQAKLVASLVHRVLSIDKSELT